MAKKNWIQLGAQSPQNDRNAINHSKIYKLHLEMLWEAFEVKRSKQNVCGIFGNFEFLENTCNWFSAKFSCGIRQQNIIKIGDPSRAT